MPSVLSKDEWSSLVVQIVEKGLNDESVEVRVKSGQVLSGLLHCAFISKEERERLLVSYANISNSKLSILKLILKLWDKGKDI